MKYGLEYLKNARTNKIIIPNTVVAITFPRDL